jgi:beta-glucosidase
MVMSARTTGRGWRVFAIMLVLSLAGCAEDAPSPPRDVESLLAEMTLDEKAGQMTQAARDVLGSGTEIRDLMLGSVFSGGGSAPADNRAVGWADMYDRFQGYALQTRLGIPILYGVDAVHGHNNVRGAVIFPLSGYIHALTAAA